MRRTRLHRFLWTCVPVSLAALLSLPASAQITTGPVTECAGKACGSSCHPDGAGAGERFACTLRGLCQQYTGLRVPSSFCPNPCAGKSCGETCCPQALCTIGSHACDPEGNCVGLQTAAGVQCPLEDPCSGAACGDPCCIGATSTPCIADGRCTAEGLCERGFARCPQPAEACLGKTCGDPCCANEPCRVPHACNARGQCIEGAGLCTQSILDSLPGDLCELIPCDECQLPGKGCGDPCLRNCKGKGPECESNGWCTEQSFCSANMPRCP